MNSPATITRRANAIMIACGGAPDRITLAHPTPAVEVAWLAYQAEWHMMFARYGLGFLAEPQRRGTPSLRWAYVAYRKSRLGSRQQLRLAGDYLRKAEAGFAALVRCEHPGCHAPGTVWFQGMAWCEACVVVEKADAFEMGED